MVEMQTPVLFDDRVGVVQAGNNIEETYESKCMQRKDDDDQAQRAFK